MRWYAYYRHGPHLSRFVFVWEHRPLLGTAGMISHIRSVRGAECRLKAPQEIGKHDHLYSNAYHAQRAIVNKKEPLAVVAWNSGVLQVQNYPGEHAMALKSFEEFTFAHDGAARTVYCAGRGPGVVIMHEIPGITPQVAAFAQRVAEAGFSAFLPHMFGTPGRPLSMPSALGQMARACISREFHVLAKRESSPITDWLRG